MRAELAVAIHRSSRAAARERLILAHRWCTRPVTLPAQGVETDQAILPACRSWRAAGRSGTDGRRVATALSMQIRLQGGGQTDESARRAVERVAASGARAPRHWCGYRSARMRSSARPTRRAGARSGVAGRVRLPSCSSSSPQRLGRFLLCQLCRAFGADRTGLPERPGTPHRRGLRHILVDEFQDTSYEQLELLRALMAGWERGDGRTLFVVGDPMQSIYQFGKRKSACSCVHAITASPTRCWRSAAATEFSLARGTDRWVNDIRRTVSERTTPPGRIRFLSSLPGPKSIAYAGRASHPACVSPTRTSPQKPQRWFRSR